MYNPDVRLDERTASDTVPVNVGVDTEADRIIHSLCQLCTNGVDGRMAIFAGQECNLGILKEKSYIINTSIIEKDGGDTIRVTVKCNRFRER